MKIKILLNGVGRIGKSILRLLDKNKSFEVTTINEINPHIENIVYAINYDSTYGPIKDKFETCGNNHIKNSNSRIKILNKNSLFDINLKDIDIIIDASGKKVDSQKLESLDVKAIFLTHPNKDANINVVLGVNEKKLNPSHKVISTSSCNATALLPLLKIIDEKKKIQCADIVTVHPLLNHQKVLDAHYSSSEIRDVTCNFEFGRSATQNIIPNKTTTIEACSYVLPHLNSELISSSSLRVPTETVGAIAVTLFVEKKSSKEEIIKLLEKFEKKQKYPIVLNNTKALVSSDFKKEKYTTIIDHRYTDIKNKKMIKFLVWYDNEWGYASKVIDILKYWSLCFKNKI